MGRITRQTLKRERFQRVLDIRFVGSYDYWNYEHQNSMDWEWQDWMSEVFPEASKFNGILAEAGMLLLHDKFVNAYEQHCETHDDEPQWINKLPYHNRGLLRWIYFAQSDPEDVFENFANLPFSGLGYQIMEGSITEQLIRGFKLHRLSGIKQLGGLHYPIIFSHGAAMYVREFPHDRYAHSNDVGTMAILILYNNNRTELELLTGNMAGRLHDILTPAYGDSTKLIDKKEFDEDRHFPEALANFDWSQVPAAPKGIAKLLPPIIMNKGLIGQVLDIADKLAYVGRDLYEFYVAGPKLEGYEEIRKLLRKEPQPCSLWECAEIQDDQLYFSDKDRLINFLMIRATLFSKLYNNAASRFWENFLMTFLKNQLYIPGRITKTDLLRMGDRDVEDLINREIGENFFGDWIGSKEERMETFATIEEAQKRRADLIAKNRSVAMIEKSFVAKPGVHFHVETERGLQPLSQADPDASKLIRQTIIPTHEYALFYLDVHRNNLPKKLRRPQDWI